MHRQQIVCLAATAVTLVVRTECGDHDFLPALRAVRNDARRLQDTTLDFHQCTMRSARILPTPSLKEYDRCLEQKVTSDTHDWGLPGAEFAALIDCWCSNNLSATIADYGCCKHPSFERMCSLECVPDCTSPLAKRCIEECPSMCLEAGEYIVEQSLCENCNAETCFPVLKCLTNHAENLTELGELARTCHETDFYEAPELKQYWQCWRNIPKHSSHWNVLSSVMHCACREGMPQLANTTDCCESVRYGGGVCGTMCPSETECASQEAQTCIHKCNELCASVDPTPSNDCKNECISKEAPCRRYLGCRTPMLPAEPYVCDDGQMPESSTGCCGKDLTRANGSMVWEKAGCPKKCETQFVWRMDRAQGYPWWARWNDGSGIVYQCTCAGCPERTAEGVEEVKKTLEDSIWDNGQVMLVDIARREGLELGPNRRMQELMVERNKAVTDIAQSMSEDNQNEVEQKIESVNAYYSVLIAKAARDYPDDGGTSDGKGGKRGREDDEKQLSVVFGVLLGVAMALVFALLVAIYWLVRRKKYQDTPITSFGPNDHVVIGSPVGPADGSKTGKDDGVVGGAAVTVSAPTKSKSPAVDLS